MIFCALTLFFVSWVDAVDDVIEWSWEDTTFTVTPKFNGGYTLTFPFFDDTHGDNEQSAVFYVAENGEIQHFQAGSDTYEVQYDGEEVIDVISTSHMSVF